MSDERIRETGAPEDGDAWVKTFYYEADGTMMTPEELRKAVEDPQLQRRIRERRIIGSTFPSEPGRVSMNEASHIVTDLRMALDGKGALVTLEILDTEPGRALKDALASGCEPRLGAAGVTSPLTISTFNITDLRQATARRRFQAKVVAPDLNADLTGQALDEAAERIAHAFHDSYEALAPAHGYKTREASAVPWAEVPAANRALMVATARRLLQARAIVPGPDLDADEDADEDAELPELDLKLTVREVRSAPRRLRTTIDTRSRCGWLQTMTHGLTVWRCDALSGDLQGDGWELMFVSGWGLPVCPLHREGGEKRQEALVGLKRVRRPKPPEEWSDDE